MIFCDEFKALHMIIIIVNDYFRMLSFYDENETKLRIII